jgi:hypothetical protein
MNKDKAVELAQSVGLVRRMTISDDYRELLSAFATAILADSKQEPIGEVVLDEDNMKYIKWKTGHWSHVLSAGDKLYTSPQPLESECARYREALINIRDHSNINAYAVEIASEALGSEE